MKKKVLINTLIIAIFIIFYAPVGSAQSDTRQVIEQMTASSKIIKSDLVLEDFIAGRETTRVIVTLKESTGFQQSIGMDKDRTSQSRITRQSHQDGHIKDPVFRGRLQMKVGEAQDTAVRSLDPSRVRITNRFKYIFGFSAEVTPEGLREIEALKEVVSISKDVVLHKHLAQGIPLMNASSVRSTYDGSGMAIAICDTGIDTAHPALGGVGSPIFNSKVIGGYDTGDNDSDPRPHATDGDPHGTACAGIAAGDLGSVGDYIGGVAHNAKLYALKISTGDTGSASTSNMIEAWEWCLTHQNDDPNNPIMVISTSFGGGHYTSACDGDTPAMTDAARNAVAAGITLFASTGNDGFCEATGWPACITHVNAVGAVYDANIGNKSGWCIDQDSCIGYSNNGCSFADNWACDDPSTAADQVTCYSNSATFMDLFAPSNNAYTTDIVGSGGDNTSGDYISSFGGTSAACPYAAGAAASLQSAAKEVTGSFLSPDLVRFILTSSGDMVTDPKASFPVTIPRVNLQAAADLISGLSGVILDDNGSPMSGVRVSCEGDDWWTSTSTNPDGSFQLALPAGGMEFAVEPEVSTGHAWYINDYYLDPGEVRDLGTIQLKNGALVTGHVYYDDGSPDGTPLDMVEYWVGGRFYAVWGETDSSGYFEFRLPAGSYIFNLGDDQGFLMVPVQIDVTDVNATYDLDNIPASRPNRKFYDFSSNVDLISGNVSDNGLAHNGEFAVVSFLNSQEITPDNLGGIAPLGANYVDPFTGNYGLMVPPTADYDRNNDDVKVGLVLMTEGPDDTESITVVDSALDVTTPNTVNLTYASEGQTVQGYIKDNGTGQGIYYASVSLFEQSTGQFAGVAETDHNGRYVFYNVQPATYRLAAVAQDYGDTEWSRDFDVAGDSVILDDIFLGAEKEKFEGDFNGDGNTDILWRHRNTGQVYIWLMNGTDILSKASPGTVSDLAWEIVDVGDCDGDGKTDLVWRHRNTGQVYIWLMNGTDILSKASPGTVSDLAWEIVDVGDCDGDGKTDLVWRHRNTGQVYIWLMNGTDILSKASPGTVSDLAWEIVDVGDCDGDGKTDLVWRHRNTGQVYIWLMNGTDILSKASPGTVSDLAWEIVDVGDCDGDGKTDLVWRHRNTGQVYIWLMNGTDILSKASPGTVSDLAWEIVDVGDCDGDGKTDLVWRHRNTGQVYIWLMNGTDILSKASPGTVSDLAWEIVDVGDCDGDGKTDLVWRHRNTGQVYIWLMNGTDILSKASPGTVSDLAWEIP